MEKNKDTANPLQLLAEYAGLWALEKYRQFAEMCEDATDVDFGTSD